MSFKLLAANRKEAGKTAGAPRPQDYPPAEELGLSNIQGGPLTEWGISPDTNGSSQTGIFVKGTFQWGVVKNCWVANSKLLYHYCESSQMHFLSSWRRILVVVVTTHTAAYKGNRLASRVYSGMEYVVADGGWIRPHIIHYTALFS